MVDVDTKIVDALDLKSPSNHAINRSHNRRDLLRVIAAGGIGAWLSTAITGCASEVADPTVHVTFNFSSDQGVLNFTYVYLQFMADFYNRIGRSKYVGMTINENNRLSTLAYQKEIHRNALQQLTPGPRMDAALFDVHTVDFSSREAVLGFAQTFEDLGVATLNGLTPLLRDATNLTFIGKTKSGWARHAALIRDLIDIAAGTSRIGFVGTVDSRGLDQATTVSAALTLMRPYFRTTLSAIGAP